MPAELQAALARGSLLLAASERAAQSLRTQLDTTQVLSWNTFLRSLWSTLILNGADHRLLLNPPQEHTLWRDIIAATPEFSALTDLDSLADLAQSAYSLAAAYDALPHLRRTATTHDARTFATWATAFNRRCDQRALLSLSELPQALREHLENQTLTPPPAITLIAFDDDTPARTHLLTALTQSGTHITHINLPALAPEPGCPILTTVPSSLGWASSEARPLSPEHPTHLIVRAPNPTDELQTAAHYVRHFILTRAAANLPHRVALIVPTLADEQPLLESTLRHILSPELEAITADLSSAPFAFSTNIPLADTALITTALDLLRWTLAPLPLDTISALLLSSYLGAIDTTDDRATFDAFTLRRTELLRPELDIPTLLTLARNHPAITPILTPLTTRIPTTASYADWTDHVRNTLEAVHWPGYRPLTAQEFRDARTWDHVLDAVATLDFAGQRVDFATALAAIERQARATTSSPSTIEPALQILTPADAAGLIFDALIFLRATDANWPTPERPNPLLPWPLQYDLHMPGADPARASARAAEATARLTKAAPTVLFFYAVEDETGPQRLSPLIANLNWPQIETTNLLSEPWALNPGPLLTLETLPDTAPLPGLASTAVRGGSLVLKLQAACSFRAFATLRLNATPLNTTTPGFDAGESGTLLHAVMANFWSHVETQQNLRSMSPDDRTTGLRSAIDATFPRPAANSPWEAAYIAVQKDRMTYLLLQWLDRELDRAPFTVTSSEQKRAVTVGPLTLNLRVDRIDAVEGGTLLVDYKTGARSSPADWRGPRPDDPQLPLYALLPEAANLQGVAFAKIRPGKDMKWSGYGPLPKPSPMEQATLEDQIASWRTVLEHLAHDFAHGQPVVSPKDYPFTCTHCDQRLLCRLDIATLATGEEAEAPDAE